MKNEWRDRPNPTHNTQITPRQAGQQTHAKPGNAHHTHNPKPCKPQALTTELQRPCSQQKAATTTNYAEDGPLSDKQKPPSSAPTEATHAANKKLPLRQIMQRTDPTKSCHNDKLCRGRTPLRQNKNHHLQHQLKQHMQPTKSCHHDRLCRGRTPLEQKNRHLQITNWGNICSHKTAATTTNYAEGGPLSDKEKPPSSEHQLKQHMQSLFRSCHHHEKITVTTEQYQAQWTHNPHLPQCAMTHKAPQAHFCWK